MATRTMTPQQLGGLRTPIVSTSTATNDAAFKAVLDAIGAEDELLLLPPVDGAGNNSTWTVSTQDITVPRNVTLRVPHGTLVTVSAGRTLTLNGPVIADDPDWYSGLGTVTFNYKRWGDEEAYAEAFLQFVISGGTHATAGTTTSPAFSVQARTSAGRYVQESSITVTYTAGAGTYWVVANGSTTDTIAGWTRESGTHILWQQNALQPSLPANSAWLMQVTVDGVPAITVVTDIRDLTPPTKFVQAGIGAVASSVRAKLGETVSVKDFGAVGDGVTDDTAAIQAALDALAVGDALYFPSTGAAAYYRITTALLLPTLNNIVLYGNGFRASRIIQTGAGAACLDSNNVWATSTNGIVIRDLWLDTDTTGTIGIDLKATNRAKILNVRIANFDTAGINHVDSLITDIRGCEFDTNQDGIVGGGGGNTAMNGVAVHACTFENQTRYAMNISSFAGVSVVGCTIENNLKGALNFTGTGHGLHITGNYNEANLDGIGSTFDVQLGTSAIVSGVTITGNLFSGATAHVLHIPLRLGVVSALMVTANEVNQGQNFVNFEAGNSVTNSRFGPVYFNNAAGAGAMLSNFPPLFIHNRNAMDFQATENVADNYDSGNIAAGQDFPLNAWAVSGAGVTLDRSPNTGATPSQYNGRPVGMLTTPVGANGTASVTFTVSATENALVRGNYVTAMLDVYVDNAAARVFNLKVDDTAAQSHTTPSLSVDETNGWQRVAVSGFFSTATTAIRLLFSTESVSTSYRLANPRLYASLDAATLDALSGPVTWSAAAAPTTGTWAVGDRVWNTAPTAATATDMGWVCTTAGTGGGALVFSAFGDIA